MSKPTALEISSCKPELDPEDLEIQEMFRSRKRCNDLILYTADDGRMWLESKTEQARKRKNVEDVAITTMHAIGLITVVAGVIEGLYGVVMLGMCWTFGVMTARMVAHA